MERVVSAAGKNQCHAHSRILKNGKPERPFIFCFSRLIGSRRDRPLRTFDPCGSVRSREYKLAFVRESSRAGIRSRCPLLSPQRFSRGSPPTSCCGQIDFVDGRESIPRSFASPQKRDTRTTHHLLFFSTHIFAEGSSPSDPLICVVPSAAKNQTLLLSRILPSIKFNRPLPNLSADLDSPLKGRVSVPARHHHPNGPHR